MRNIYILLLPLLFCCSACDKWLDVGSQNELTQEDLMSTDAGFQAALSGIYISMNDPGLYSKNLSWHMIDYLAHYYTRITGSYDVYLYDHQYTHTRVEPYISAIWDGLYEMIANCNNLIRQLEEKKEEINPLNYALIRGEALALRAFFHLDLMRLFGYGQLGERDLSGKLAIPYVTEFKKDLTPQRGYEETLELLKKDLREAGKLLWGDQGKSCFRYTQEEAYFEQANGSYDYFYTTAGLGSCVRIDYFAARAILARVLMWEGKSENYKEVVEITNEWIAQEGKCWNWISMGSITGEPIERMNRVFTTENVWQLRTLNLFNIVGEWFGTEYTSSTPSERIQMSKGIVDEIYDSRTRPSDWRWYYLMSQPTASNDFYVPLKIKQKNSYSYRDIIPLISTAELYYMRAEAYLYQGELQKALDDLNTVRTQRGVVDYPLNASQMSKEEVKSEILKEAKKEFVCLGQMFYFYKRLGVRDIYNAPGEMTDLEYVLPYPEHELRFGNRKQ